MTTKKIVLLFLLSICLGVQTVAAQKPISYLTEPALSPDRREIAFVSGGDVWTVPAAGGAASILVAHPATESRPMYSPDGKFLAFTSTRTGNGDVYTLNLETGDLKRITFDDAAETLDAWSRDGNWLYFSSTSKDIFGMSDIFRVRAAGGGTPMTFSADRYTNEFQAAPAPDNADVMFAARGISNSQWWRKGHSHIDETELWLKSGDNYTQLVGRDAKQQFPMWNADGSRIYYVSDKSGAQNVWTQSLKGQPKQLTNFTDGRVLWANIAYDGKQIVFERDFKIWLMDADNGKTAPVAINLRGAAASPLVDRVNLSGQIREMALSPDGKKLALVARGEIFAASAKEAGDAVRVTDTAAPESLVVWSPDSRRIVYASERDGAMRLYTYDFATETESKLTDGSGADYAPAFAPDGKSLAFIRNARSLMLYDFDKKTAREIAKIYIEAPPLVGTGTIVWSPDSRNVAFWSYAPENRSYVNVYVASANGNPTAEKRAVSFLANSNGNTISWSPDGTFILFDTNQRTEEGSLARVDLTLRTPRFREDQFRDLFKQENPRDRTQQPIPQPSSTPQPTQTPTTTTQTTPAPQTSPSPGVSPTPTTATPGKITTPSDLVASDKKDDKKPVEIVYENIRQRLSLLRPGINVNGQTISPDGKTVLILATAENQFNLYTMPLDELATDTSAKQLTSTPGFKSDAAFTPDGKEVYFVENGRVQIVSVDKREVRPLAVNLEMTVNFADEKRQVFEQGWRYLRDHFYDEKFHGVDWNVVRTTYEPLIAAARTPDETRRLMSLMVGELNASHLGVTAPFAPGQPQTTPVGKLGLRFDRQEYENNGRLKITEIIALSPAAVVKDIKVGDYLLSVDKVRIDGKTNLDEQLENKVNRRVELEISGDANGSNKRTVILKPVNTTTEKNLLYRQWVEQNRAYVERISNGKLGYVHLPDMGAGSLAQLYVDLDVQNQSKQGVIVDIRNNNGGFINPYVIDVFARRGYLNMTERGGWTVPARSALGQRALERPTILVTNQHSLSDAEDLTEGYRSLKLGKVVGEPTAGWIIFTWTLNLFDGTGFRLPRQGITGNDGKNMELNPRPVDLLVTRPVGETLRNQDSQLDAAARELQTQIGGR